MCIPEEKEEEECWLDTVPLSPQWSLETKAEVSSSRGSPPPPFLDKGCLIAEGCQHPPPSGSDGKVSGDHCTTCRGRQPTVQSGN